MASYKIDILFDQTGGEKMVGIALETVGSNDGHDVLIRDAPYRAFVG